MMKKVVKYTFISAIIMSVLVVFFVLFLLYTTTGARWALSFLSNDHSPEIQFSGIEGNLANELKLSSLKYNDDAVHVEARNIVYTIREIQWFDFGLTLDSIGVDSLVISLADVDENTINDDYEFAGLSLPFKFKVDRSFIKDMTINYSGGSEQFYDLSFSIHGEGESLVVNDFSVKHDIIDIKSEGKILLNAGLKYEFLMSFNLDDFGLSGSSKVIGDLNQLKSTHELHMDDEKINGDYHLTIVADLSKNDFPFHSTLISDHTKFKGLDAEIDSIAISVFGDMQNYQITGSSIGHYVGFEHLIEINGKGDAQSLLFDQISIVNADSAINNTMNIDWENAITVSSDMVFTNVTPEAYIKDWKGVIEGNLSFRGQYFNQNDYELSVNEIDLIGELRDQDFKFMGSVNVKNDSIEVHKGHLTLDDNIVKFDGKTVNGNIAGNFYADISDLGSIHQGYEGKINTEISVKGQLNNPRAYQVSGFAKGRGIKMKGISAENIFWEGQGQLDSMVHLSLSGSQIIIADQHLDKVMVNLSGSLDEHLLEVELKNEMLMSSLKAKGQWNQQNNSWLVQVNQHDLHTSKLNTQWQLTNRINIQIGSDLSSSRGCWVEKYSNAHACLDFNSHNKYSSYQGHLELKDIALEPFEKLMPTELKVDGSINGYASIKVENHDVKVDANLALYDGILKYAIGNKEQHITTILNAQILAKHEHDSSLLTTDIKLDDGTYFSIKSDLSLGKNDELELDGSIKGAFTNSRYLSSLSEEIKEISGEMSIDGTIKGSIKRPLINLNAKQNGFVILERLGSQLKNLSISVNNNYEMVGLDHKFDYTVSGETDAGSLTSKGQVSLDEDNNWQVKGALNGENFRLLTLPEIQLQVSPELDFIFKDDKVMITGDVNIPYGAVKIQTLPESAVVVSPDVVIHSESYEENLNGGEISVLFDINTHLENPIELNAVGLNTQLTGNLRVSNIQNASINGYGKLQLHNGKYQIYGQTLDIFKGELIFDGLISNPSIDIIAHRKSISENVLAGVELGGTINTLQSELYSEPLLPDLEILSYILTGRGLNQESKLNSERLIQAALLLGLKKSSPIFSQIQSTLGIDVLAIKEGTTTQESVIEAGKKINEDIYIGYNHGLFNRIGFWILRYQLNKSLRLETSQGENQSIDLIYVRKKK